MANMNSVETKQDICLAVPADLAERRRTSQRTFDAIALWTSVQMAAIAVFGLLLQFH